MGSDAAFLALANMAIEAEIRTYFPYTALYRRLCRGGSERAMDYLHREFSPALVDAADDGTPATADLVAGVAASSAGLSQTQHKRRRASLVGELQKSLEEFAAATARLVRARLESTALSGKQSEVCDNEAVTVPSTPGEAGAEPYTVTCRRCTTNVTCTYPCWVLEGYVVLWAESVLEVECVATKAAIAASLLASPVVAAHTQGNSSVKDSLGLRRPRGVINSRDSQAANIPHSSSGRLLLSSNRPLGLRPLLQRLTGALDGSAEDATAPPAPLLATARAKAARSRKQRGCSHSDGTHPGASTGPPPPATQMLRLHSMCIVNSDAVGNVRPASFALQSVLQPGWQTALECYPRHMVHFGLLVYAAWHASSRTWESVLSHGDTCRDGSAAAGNGHTVMLPSRSSRGDAALQNTSGERGASHTSESTTAPTSSSPTPEAGGEMRPASLVKLLPHTSHDAVLILGLGGNVLGQCLDALLPAAVPLHVVEVEPAVLQACCENGQFPAIDVVDDWRGELDAAPSCNALKRASAPHKKDASPRRSEEMLETAPAASLVCPAVMQWAAGLIHRKSATPAAFRAMRQQAPALLERLAAPPSAMPSGATKRATCAPSLRRGSGTVVEAPLQAQQERGEYVCFLQDAYAYLRTSASFPTTSTSAQETCPRFAAQSRTLSSKQENESSSAVEDAPLSSQYSMIFLDCYDPDREHMMHEGTLVELCARRLQPGGVLVVNAHVLPSVENLRRDFLGCGFSTVQALRVAGHTQTVVVCVAQDKAADGEPAAAERLASSASCAPMLTEKRGRFTVRQMQVLATALNGVLHVAGSSSSSVTDGGDGAGRDKSCRRVVVPPSKVPSSRRARPASTTPSQACSIDVDLRVWEHYF
ncbi:hypothetical protein CGC21_22385 [Leishmania donovani]|uniref:Uncharacterized protein n=1 Tax=Leishmania donovani TaxID=5661 RepID=A0A504Y5A2_LEIDO|nr:hypothetical protein CGC21_22385 [Leishmania donovani]